MRKGSVKFDYTWRKWVVKLRKWELYASFKPPLRSLKFLFSCCDNGRNIPTGDDYLPLKPLPAIQQNTF